MPLTSMLCDSPPLPLFADDDLQLRVLDDDTEPSRHSGRAFSAALTTRQLNTPRVLLCCYPHGSLEVLVTPVAHHDLRPDVVEEFAAIGSAVND